MKTQMMTTLMWGLLVDMHRKQRLHMDYSDSDKSMKKSVVAAVAADYNSSDRNNH